MNQYRKKPLVVEAFQMTRDRRWDNSEWPNWLNEAWNKAAGEGGLWCSAAPKDQLFLGTPEGVHRVSWGEWIIKGVHGELYPCKDAIFKETYEAVE